MLVETRDFFTDPSCKPELCFFSRKLLKLIPIHFQSHDIVCEHDVIFCLANLTGPSVGSICSKKYPISPQEMEMFSPNMQ